MSVQSAGTLGTVWDPVGLFVDGSQTRWWRGRVLSVTLHPREQDAAEGGLGGRMQHELGGEACKCNKASGQVALWTENNLYTSSLQMCSGGSNPGFIFINPSGEKPMK